MSKVKVTYRLAQADRVIRRTLLRTHIVKVESWPPTWMSVAHKEALCGVKVDRRGVTLDTPGQTWAQEVQEATCPRCASLFRKILRDHVAELHPKMARIRHWRTLQRQHGRDHHRLTLGHTHEEDQAGVIAGPNTKTRRPSGWLTGLGVIIRR